MNLMISAALGLALASSASAAPMMTMLHSAASSGSVPEGTTSYTLDVTLDSGGYEVSGLWAQFVAPAGASYGTTPLTMLDSPFVDGDVAMSPVAGDPVNGSSVMLFKAAGADYPALVPQAIFRLHMDPSALAPGIYTFTPVGLELTNVDITIDTFAAPESFILTVTPVPEPTMLALGAVGPMVLLRRPRGTGKN